MIVPTSDFLDLLVPPSADGFVELRAFNDRADLPPRSSFVPAGASNRGELIERDVYAWLAAGYDVYQGVAERWTDQPTPDHRRGGKLACSWLRVLFVDVDLAKSSTSEEAARAKLAQLPAAFREPSIIVRSGGGWHVYWVLKQPVDVRGVTARDNVEALLRRLSYALDGDKAATDVSRVLRVPGTFNMKPDRDSLVRVTHFRPEVRV